jgi:hypothetical protein
MKTNTLQRDIETGTPAGHVTEISPETAERWLERNANNRTIRQADVDKYARDMVAGNWQMTGEAIKFGSTGVLLDGQHRLWAIVESGQTVRMMVVTGLPPEAQSVMDSGVKRSAGDSLHLTGTPSANLVAAVARLGITYDNGYLTRARSVINGQDVPSPTHAEIRQWVDLNPNVVDCVNYTRRWPGRSKAAAATGLLVTRRIDVEEATEFFQRIIDLDFRGKGDPAKTLYERLLSSQTNRERMSNVTELHLIFRAWNAERDGQQLAKMTIRNSATPFEIPR